MMPKFSHREVERTSDNRFVYKFAGRRRVGGYAGPVWRVRLSDEAGGGRIAA